MAIRTAMLPIIDKIREMIGDPASASQNFSQQQIQDALDESRFDVRYELLIAAPTITNDVNTNAAVFVWIDYYSTFQYWEMDTAVAQWGDFTQRVPVATEFIAGHWQFSVVVADGSLPARSDAPGQYPPIFVTGRAYDIYAAAVKMLRLLKAKLMLTTYNFSANSQSFQRGGILQTIDGLMADYARKVKPRMIALDRTDSAHPYIIDVPVLLSGMNDRLP